MRLPKNGSDCRPPFIKILAGWRMWAISLLTIMFLLPLLSAAPLDIAGDIMDDNDGLHSHDENVTRRGKFFGHNQFDMGDMNISGSVAGDVVSIGHQVNIDVHGHTHDHHHHEADTVECKEGLRVLFKSIDSNKNGLMDAKELLRVCRQNNFQMTESSAVRILTLPDKTVGFNMAKFCELLKDCPSTDSVDIIYFLLQLYDKGISTAETNNNIRAIEDFIATIQTIEDELNFFSDVRGNAATNNLSGDEVITQLINFFSGDESNIFGHEKKLFEIITRAIMHFYRVWHTQFRNPDFQAIMPFYRVWNTQFNNPMDFKIAGALRSKRSSLQPSFAEIKRKLDAHEQATTNCRTGNCNAEKIEAMTKAAKFHLDEIKNTGRVGSEFQQSFPTLKKTVDSVAEKVLVAEKAKLAGRNPTTLTLPTTGTPLKKWIGGFPESNPAFAYPSPNLTHFENGSVLPLLGNMDNIDKLDLQLGVKWPEFSWETELGKPESRTFEMFAPYISRLGYTVEGRVFSIICPQQGAYSPTLGSLNVEVTVTGQRGWVNQPKRTMAADMTVVGKIWFGPGAKENWLVRLLWHLFELSSLPFPHSKKNAIIVNTHSRSFTDQSFFSLRHGESTEFEIPEFAKHPEAWSVGNLGVQIGQIKKTGSEVVDTFNQLILDIFNTAKGNMLKEKNTLYWNVWFTQPQNVNRTEWRNHAEIWRDSIDTGHGSPDGNGTYPKYFNGTLFKPFKEESPEKWIENELEKILHWLKKHINILKFL